MVRPCALLSLFLACAPVWGQESAGEAPWQPTIVTHLSGGHGLTGYGSMVDGRIPSPFLATPQEDSALGAYSNRFTLRYDYAFRNRRVHGQGLAKTTLEEREHALVAAYGLTVQGLDLSIGLPYAYQERGVLAPGPNPARDRDGGVGDLRVGAKVAFRIPNFFLEDWAIAALAPYVFGRVPTGASSVRGDAQVEWGVAIAGPFGYGFRYNGNLGFFHSEGGLTAMVYRFGFSHVPVASPDFALRFYSHLDGIEYEGDPGSTLRWELGGQVLIASMVSVELGAAWRFADASFGESALRRELRGVGDRFDRVRDEGAFTVTVAVGILL